MQQFKNLAEFFDIQVQNLFYAFGYIFTLNLTSIYLRFTCKIFPFLVVIDYRYYNNYNSSGNTSVCPCVGETLRKFLKNVRNFDPVFFQSPHEFQFPLIFYFILSHT